MLWCRPLGSYVSVFCGVICRRAQRPQHFVVTQLCESNAPLVRAIEPTQHESSCVNLFRPCRVCRRGTTPSTLGSGQGCLVICKYCVAPKVACRVSVKWFAREVMLFSPRVRRCGTSQTLSIGDGLTRKPIGDYGVVNIALQGCLGSVIASRFAVSRLDGCCCIRWTCHALRSRRN